MSLSIIPYGFATELDMPFAEALQRTRGALAAEGFGVLSEIDVALTLHRKLGVDVPPYTILGACNPPLAYRALQADPNIGLLLPCNVVVREGAEPGRTVVAAIDPEKQIGLADGGALGTVASDAAVRLWRALIAVGAKGESSITETGRPVAEHRDAVAQSP